MIRYLDKPPGQAWLDLCAKDPVLGTRMLTMLEAYGTGGKLVDFWTMDAALEEEPVAALMRFDGWMSIVGDWERMEVPELGAFLQVVGEIGYVEGLPEICRGLTPWLSGTYTGSHTMVYPGAAFGPGEQEIDGNPDLEQVYTIIMGSGGFADRKAVWDAWYPHASHILRHKLGFAAVLSEQGVPVATGGVYATGGTYGVISGVATLPDYRGRGYGAAIMAYLCTRCIQQGLLPVLRCTGDSLAHYYSGLGFGYLGGWAQIALDG